MSKQVDELSVDLNQAAQEVLAEAAADTAVDNFVGDSDASSEPELELPESSFWQDSVDSPEPKQSSSNNQNTESNPSSAGTIKYKVDGKEVEVSLEEARKQLSLAAGARRAFSEKAKIKKELEQIKQQQQELAKYKESWDKLEAIKDDPEKLVEILLNKPYQQFEKELYERRKLYEEATPEERQLMEYEARMRNLERDSKRTREEMERKAKEVEEREFATEQRQLQTAMEREFFKHKVIDSNDPQVANKLKKMLWRQSVADLKDLSNRGITIGPKAIAKVFADNAKALNGFKSETLNKELKSIVDKKKQAATEKAQLASSANYSASIDPSFLKLDPAALFQRWRSGR